MIICSMQDDINCNMNCDIIHIITDQVFKQRDMLQIGEANLICILRSYSTCLFDHYCNRCINSIPTKDLSHIKFLCIRVIYLALSLDEMSSNKKLYDLPHYAIGLLVHKTPYSSKMKRYELDILDFCKWNPVRFCKNHVKLDIGSPLYDECDIGCIKLT